MEERISFSGVKFTEIKNVKKAEDYLTSYFDIISVEAFSLKSKDLAISVAANSFTLYWWLTKG